MFGEIVSPVFISSYDDDNELLSAEKSFASDTDDESISSADSVRSASKKTASCEHTEWTLVTKTNKDKTAKRSTEQK